MRLNNEGLKDRKSWENAGYSLPEYDRETVTKATRENPFWIHFGAGNIFRAFQANVVQDLLNQGVLDRGLVVAEGYDYEIIQKMNHPHDDYSILVTLKANGTVEKTIVGSVVESLALDSDNAEQFQRLKEIFSADSLQMASFTITEKGYNLYGADGKFTPLVATDLAAGPEAPISYIGKVASLLYARFLAGEKPIAMVSMDNCSHNGDKLAAAIGAFAEGWSRNGLADKDFESYIKTSGKVSFPWTMIDKITPRPDASIEALLKKDGVEELDPVITGKHTYVAPFVNAEECQYLVIEDNFPNGRPALEKGGLIFTTRETVDKVEKMKVCTCLNPLHTALAVFGCLMGYTLISEEMKNPSLKKLAIRFGETIKAYAADPKLNVGDLKFIPLVFAGWLRYLMGVDDNGKAFTLSSDPRLQELTAIVSGISLGASTDVEAVLDNVLSDASIWGVDLKALGMDTIVCRYFQELIAGPGAVAAVLNKYTS